MTGKAQVWRFLRGDVSPEAGRNAENRNWKGIAKHWSTFYLSRTLQDHVKGRRAERHRLGGKRTHRQHEKLKQMARHAYLD